MEYSKELITEIKELYPDFGNLYSHVDNGLEIVGHYLWDTNYGFDYEVILMAKSLESLKEKAMLLKRKAWCYKKWRDEYYK